jgi:hypothetical protein
MPFSKSLSICLFLLASRAAHAEYQWGFANVSFNRLNWTQETKDKSTKLDFNYLEVEGGSQYSWGELYGFYDIENFDKDGDEMRTAAKGSIRYYLGETGFSLYAHVYNFTSLGFAEQNRVVGFGYQWTGPSGWWFKPFLGFHDVSQTFFSGPNGFMGGWVLGIPFKIADQRFLLSDWHEYEFARKDAYAAGNGGKNTSHNGAVGLWWTPLEAATFGIQWRYANDKLGTEGTMGASIFTAKYNF